ncbi:MAG: FecR family protein [Synergistaceae bacterium]|jgi:hypothetical protein|nr:FecR family protein [Synergistaceae bacterium]
MRRFLAIPLIVISILFWTSSCEPATFEDESKGYVETLEGRLVATRDMREVVLEEGSDIYEYDILETDSDGSAVIHFLDDSILEMGSGTRVDVKEVVFTSARKRFNVGLAHGIARVITGAIVKFNPKVFKLTTPKSSIGIRGTTLRVEVMEKYERVTVEDLSEGSAVSCTNTDSGDSFTMTEIQDSVTISSVENVDPVSGVISTTTETTTEGIGVMEGIQDPGGIGGIGGTSSPSSGSSQSGGDSSHSGHSSSGSGSSDNDSEGSSNGGQGSSGGCGDNNSSPGR